MKGIGNDMERESLLEKFLESKGIFIREKMDFKTSKDIQNTILILEKFHSLVKNQKNYMLGISSEAGRIREEYKLLYRRAKAVEFETGSLVNKEMLNVANRCIQNISDKEFVELINRATLNSEITFGKYALDEMILNNENIFIKNTSKIKFGMVEDDYVKLLLRVRKKNKDLNYELIKKEILKIEMLNEKSERYIDSVVLYPYEYMKCLSELYIHNYKNKDIEREKLKELAREYIQMF